jgi:hypothetical protein
VVLAAEGWRAAFRVFQARIGPFAARLRSLLERL